MFFVPEKNLKHVVSTACRPRMFQIALFKGFSNIPHTPPPPLWDTQRAQMRQQRKQPLKTLRVGMKCNDPERYAAMFGSSNHLHLANSSSMFIAWPYFVSHNLWLNYNYMGTLTSICRSLLCAWHSFGQICWSGLGRVGCYVGCGVSLAVCVHYLCTQRFLVELTSVLNSMSSDDCPRGRGGVRHARRGMKGSKRMPIVLDGSPSHPNTYPSVCLLSVCLCFSGQLSVCLVGIISDWAAQQHPGSACNSSLLWHVLISDKTLCCTRSAFAWAFQSHSSRTCIGRSSSPPPGGGATTNGPDATTPPAICQNSGGGVQPGVGGGGGFLPGVRGGGFLPGVGGGGCSCQGLGEGLAGGQGGVQPGVRGGGG